MRNPVFAAALHAPFRSARSRLLLAATALYVVGGFGVTFAFNVPLNDQLATLDLSTATAAQIASERTGYEDAWNAWNAVRTLASTLALICVALAALAPGGPLPSRRSAQNTTLAASTAPVA